MHTSRAWPLLSCCVLASACGLNAIDGSGKVVTEPRPVAGFTAVSLRGSGRLVIEQTGTDSLTVTTDDNLLPLVQSEVKGNTLELGPKEWTTVLHPTKDIVFTLHVKTLEALDISGSGDVEAKGLNPESLRVEISGSGAASVQGTANDLNLTISGSGAYQGAQLASKRATVKVSGSGSAVIAASETLNADVTGSGSIQYVGDPKVVQQITGSGSVLKR
jgi:hypothetical protein